VRDVEAVPTALHFRPHVRPQRDPDLLLVESMLAPPPLDDARRSLAYWQRRQKALPFYQRRARQEAKDMAARWDARVRAAERARFATSVAGRILAALGLSRLVARPRPTKRRLVLLAWALVPLRIKVIAGGVFAAWLIVFIASAMFAAAVLVRLA
jgi:hypothetical protein